MKVTMRRHFPFPTASLSLVKILKDNFFLLAGRKAGELKLIVGV